MLRGLPGKVDQVIVGIQKPSDLEVLHDPQSYPFPKGGEGGLTSRNHWQSTCTTWQDVGCTPSAAEHNQRGKTQAASLLLQSLSAWQDVGCTPAAAEYSQRGKT